MTDNETLFPRSSGVLLHPTSLPGPYGIGDLGDNAYRFVDWLENAGLANSAAWPDQLRRFPLPDSIRFCWQPQPDQPRQAG